MTRVGRGPAEDLQAPAGCGDPLAGSAGGVQIAAGPDVGLDQRQAEVDAQADLFDGGAGSTLIGGNSRGAGRVGGRGVSGDVLGVNLAVCRGARSTSLRRNPCGRPTPPPGCGPVPPAWSGCS